MKWLLCAVCAFGWGKKADCSFFQYGITRSFLDGDYRGEMKVTDLVRRGNFGLGMMGDLAGCLIVDKGQFYQVEKSGIVKPAKGKVALASLAFVAAPKTEKIKECSNLEQALAAVETLCTNKEAPYAVRISGTFRAVHLYNTEKQEMPYPVFSEVEKKKLTYHDRAVKGSALGFRVPEALEPLLGKGTRLAFLSDDHKFGGMVSDLSIEKGQIAVEEVSDFQVALQKERKE